MRRVPITSLELRLLWLLRNLNQGKKRNHGANSSRRILRLDRFRLLDGGHLRRRLDRFPIPTRGVVRRSDQACAYAPRLGFRPRLDLALYHDGGGCLDCVEAGRLRCGRLWAIVVLLQLGLNALWSYLFFGLKNPGLAFLDIVALWLVILAAVIAFFRHTPGMRDNCWSLTSSG